MTLSAPRTKYGIHQMTAINRTTGVPYGTIKVLGGVTADLERERSDLRGGSNPNVIDSEYGNISGEISLSFKEFPAFMYELAGYSKSTDALDASGKITEAAANKKGTSLIQATTGIASITLKSGASASVKTNKYLIEVVSGGTSVDIYSYFDNDADVGTAITYQTDLLKITASPIAITTAGVVEIPGTGLEITGGSGTIAMVAEDTSTISTLAVNTAANEYTYAGSPEPIEFEMYLESQKKSNGEFMREHFPRVKFATIPASMTEKEFSESEVTAQILYDSVLGYSRKAFDFTK